MLDERVKVRRETGSLGEEKGLGICMREAERGWGGEGEVKQERECDRKERGRRGTKFSIKMKDVLRGEVR